MSHARANGVAAPAHFAALDSVRAMAVAFVLFHHTWGLGGTPARAGYSTSRCGAK